MTKHVTDDEIQEVLVSANTAQQACERLISAALDGGGSDNVTVVVGKFRRN